MKSRTPFLLLFTIITLTCSCQQKSPYDNSTPEKMMSSLALISKQPKEHNPVPYFYRKKDAEAILSFDDAGKKALAAFENFKEALQVNFPTKIKSVRKNKIELEAQGSSFFTKSFTLSASLIRVQLQEQKTNAYEFLSASEPDENGIITVDYNMLGQKNELKVVEENGQYVMYMPDDSLQKLAQMTSFFEKADALFSGFTEKIKQEMTDANFDEKSEAWSTEYMTLVNTLN